MRLLKAHLKRSIPSHSRTIVLQNPPRNSKEAELWSMLKRMFASSDARACWTNALSDIQKPTNRITMPYFYIYTFLMQAHNKKFLSIVCPFHDWKCEDGLDPRGMRQDSWQLYPASFYLQKCHRENNTFKNGCTCWCKVLSKGRDLWRWAGSHGGVQEGFEFLWNQ